MTIPDFLRTCGRLLNAGQTRTLLLTGNVHDLFPSGDRWVSLPELLQDTWSDDHRLVLTYEINGAIRFAREADRNTVRDSWIANRIAEGADDALERLLSGQKSNSPKRSDHEQAFDELMGKCVGRPTVALEIMRQLCHCSRVHLPGKSLIVIIEAADLVLPDAPVPSLGDADRARLHICHDWFVDPAFNDGDDAVVLLAQTRAGINRRAIELPHVAEVPVPGPGETDRRAFIESQPETRDDWAERLAPLTAGLDLHGVRRLLRGLAHDGADDLERAATDAVADHITSTLGPETIAFKRPAHDLDAVVGNRRLKQFLRDELIPRIRTGGAGALAGAAVSGPVGAGKTFIFEAMAGELGLPVLELKQLRSQWFGQTDAIIEKLYGTLRSLGRAVIIVDEADTQFGGVGGGVHETEKRLTGRLLAMMSDRHLHGRIVWLLMTARIHQLTADLKRPGRAGDLIIPVLDPDEEDRRDFVRWMTGGLLDLDQATCEQLTAETGDYSAATYAAMRADLRALAARRTDPLSKDDVLAAIHDRLSADIAAVRQYQTLQALLNCTRRSLLPDAEIDDADREGWQREVAALEARGIS